jgi:DNA repair protein RecO (recombination protein O)
MPARVSEAFVLRTYPFQEGDLIVSFFTRDQGRLRGVARRARRLKSAFGSALERLSQVRIGYYQRETFELVRIESCEIIQSQFSLAESYEAGIALDFIAEVSDQLLPAHEANERIYRLLAAVLADLRASRETGLWRVVTYFSYWVVRLSGFLPDLRVSAASRALADTIATTPIAALASPQPWTKAAGADLRRFLARQIEQHIERKLVTVPLLEAL